MLDQVWMCLSGLVHALCEWGGVCFVWLCRPPRGREAKSSPVIQARGSCNTGPGVCITEVQFCNTNSVFLKNPMVLMIQGSVIQKLSLYYRTGFVSGCVSRPCITGLDLCFHPPRATQTPHNPDRFPFKCALKWRSVFSSFPTETLPNMIQNSNTRGRALPISSERA